MHPQSPYISWQRTPTPLREILATTAIASLAAPLLELFFRGIFGVIGPQTFLILSPLSVTHLWIWQWLTSLFVHGVPGAGISFSLLIELLFHLYMVWALGGSILDRIPPRSFLKFYLGTGVTAGACATVAMALTGQGAVLGGCTPPLLGILMLWTMLYPTAQLLLFFILPVQSKWLAAGAAAAITLVNLSQGAVVEWVWSMSGLFGGYLAGAMIWGLKSPFSQTHGVDATLHPFWNRLPSMERAGSNAKIVDIKTGRPLAGDDPFVDAMLDKISKQGKGSLTIVERIRLYWVTRRHR